MSAPHPVLRCLIYLVCWPVASLLLLDIASSVDGLVFPHNAGPDQSVNLLISVSCDCVAALGVALLLRRYVDHRPLATLGFTFGVRWLRLLGIGVLLGFGMQALVFALETTLGFAHSSPPRWQHAEFATLGYVIPVLILGAISEEMPFRGYLFQNLREAWGSWAALMVTSAAFAALHLFNPGAHADLPLTMAGIAASGALFSLSVMLTGSLWFAVGCHFAWNLFEGPVFGFPVSGLSFGNAHIFTQTVTGPEWFTGGSFGPEAGLSALIALAAGTAVLYALHRLGAFAR